MRIPSHVLSLLLCTGVLAACGGSGSSDSAPEQRVAGIEDFVGLWDMSTEADQQYVLVSAEGLITPYDYQGDSAGNGENCYEIQMPQLELRASATDQNTYDVFVAGTEQGIGATVAWIDGELTIVGLSQENLTATRLSGLAVEDLTLCA